jgi:hypothetical protein
MFLHQQDALTCASEQSDDERVIAAMDHIWLARRIRLGGFVADGFVMPKPPFERLRKGIKRLVVEWSLKVSRKHFSGARSL